jgi:putative ABC transport system permease protein
MAITPGLPALLGVQPLLGRGFVPADAVPGAPAVALLSYETWQRDYGGADDVLGRAITLDEVAHVVVGVMPPRWDAFASGVRPAVWLPRAFVESSVGEDLVTLGRLRVDASLVAATSELSAILARVEAGASRPFGDEAVTVRLQRPADTVGGSTREALLVLLGAVGLVLLVACSNVANLLLARGASRARELSLRSALGASAWRLVRELFAECFVLAVAAGVVGLGVSWLTLRILVPLRPTSLAAFGEAQLDPTVLAFAFGVSVVTALLSGLAPALQLASGGLGGAVRHGSSGVVRGGAGPRVRKLLVVAQMALSVVLLVSAGLLIRTFVQLQSVEIGFDAENLFSAELRLPRSKYETQTGRDVLTEQLLDRIRSSPGVAAATQVFRPPPEATMGTFTPDFEIRGVTLGVEAQGARWLAWAGPDYFSVIGIPVIEGRPFTADEMGGLSAVIINRTAANRFWPDGSALGAEIKWGTIDWMTVVGVVDDVVSFGLTRSRDTPGFYWPLQPVSGRAPLTLIVRATEDLEIAIASVRDAVRALDPEIAVASVLSTEAAFARTIATQRFNMALLAAFAGVALVLAAVGLAAVIGYEVTERTHEIGIRMALGAGAENVRRFAMWNGLAPAFVGVCSGVIAALAATQLIAGMLQRIAPRDPLTFVGVVALLVLVAFGASWLPARRATRVDPITALRAD